MRKAILVVAVLGLVAGCEVKECDPDTEDCAFEDAGPDADSDVDTDTDSDCDFETWDPAADDTCDDTNTLRTCADGDVYDTVDCAEACVDLGGGTCDVHPTEGGFACVCAGGECDYETWDNAVSDTCLDDTHLQTCVEGDLFESLDCVEECQAAVGQDGVCATLTDEPGYGCVCGSGDTCTDGTPDSCVDGEVVERCIAGIVITEDCQNWCQVEQDLDGLCDPDTQTCECF